MSGGLQACFDAAITAALAGDRVCRLGLAVSGGSDSVALLHLAADWARRSGVAVAVASVDHRLRPEAAGEARAVAAACAALGLAHDTLVWAGWDGHGNLQAAARAARRRLLAAWARDRDIRHVALGHTADDQAETVLMEIARAAGVDGLSGMSARRQAEGIWWLRPLLGQGRADLRDWLAGQGIGWADDPSNDNPRFARVRARKALAGQPGAVAALAELAASRRAEVARLDAAAREAAADLAFDRGEIRVSRDQLADWTPDAARRIIGTALRYLAPPGPAPRGAALSRLMDRIATTEGGALHGVRVLLRRGQVVLTREAVRVAPVEAAAGPLIWDRHWHLMLPEDGRVAPLGAAGVAQLTEPRALGLTRAALSASPGLWRDDSLIAAPWPTRTGLPILPHAWAASRDDFIATSFAH